MGGEGEVERGRGLEGKGLGRIFESILNFLLSSPDQSYPSFFPAPSSQC